LFRFFSFGAASARTEQIVSRLYTSLNTAQPLLSLGGCSMGRADQAAFAGARKYRPLIEHAGAQENVLFGYGQASNSIKARPRKTGFNA
jgi:hypothetical protein